MVRQGRSYLGLCVTVGLLAIWSERAAAQPADAGASELALEGWRTAWQQQQDLRAELKEKDTEIRKLDQAPRLIGGLVILGLVWLVGTHLRSKKGGKSDLETKLEIERAKAKLLETIVLSNGAAASELQKGAMELIQRCNALLEQQQASSGQARQFEEVRSALHALSERLMDLERRSNASQPSARR